MKSLLHRLDHSIPLHIHFLCESIGKMGENYARMPLFWNQKRGLRGKAKKKKVGACWECKMWEVVGFRYPCFHPIFSLFSKTFNIVIVINIP